MIKLLFSVMRRRDDLPEMRLPLALVLMLGTALFSCAGAHLLTSSVESTGSLVSMAGFAASLVFLPAAVCSYAMIILLWRRYASLLTTPVTALMLYITGCGIFASAVFLLTVLVTAYAFAVSMISRETRFRRVAAVSFSFAVCLLLSLIALVGMRYGSAEGALDAVYSFVKDTLSALYQAAGSALEEHECARAAREVLSTLPAYIGIISLTLAAISDTLAKLLFRALDCEDIFISLSHEITMPRAFAFIYIASAVMFFLSSGSDFTLLYIMMKSLTYIMILPCAAVGIGEIMKKPEDEYFAANPRNAAALVTVFLTVMFLGIRIVLVIASVCGAVKAIMSKSQAYSAN